MYTSDRIKCLAMRNHRRAELHTKEHVDHVFKAPYGQFSEFQICFCGLDSGNLKFETVRTNKQHICF